MGKNKTIINRFQSYLERTGGERHPITGHMMAEASDYQKNLYLKCLCMMSQFGTEVTKEQTHLLQRILGGIQGSESLESYMRQGLEANETTFAELVETALDAPMKRQFFFDALLINQIAPPETDTVAFLGTLAEGLGIGQDALVYMVEICRALLEQATEINSTTSPDEIELSSFLPYFKSCELAITRRTKNSIRTVYPKKTSWMSNSNFEKILLEADIDTIEIENAVIFVHDEAIFDSYDSVSFINCDFVENEDNYIQFTDCEQVSFHNCTFSDFEDFVVYFETCTHREFMNCTFKNCWRMYDNSTNDWMAESQLFGQDDCDRALSLINCEFNCCGGINGEPYYRSCIIGGSDACIVSGCTFTDCWHYHSKNAVDIDDRRRTLFSYSTVNDNNTIINSANFN